MGFIGSWQDLPTDRTLVMGVLNVTPDSFSDGGQHKTYQAAIDHGLLLASQGADIVDVGGESTRPGATRVSPKDEQLRILPVVRELARSGVVVSVDTVNASTAAAALDAGAQCINDVSGASVSAQMIELVAQSHVPYVVMHARGTPGTMDSLAVYNDVVSDVLKELDDVAQRFLDVGVQSEQLILDPGLGFAKGRQQDWHLLHALPLFISTGYRILVGASRKRFIGHALAVDGIPRPVAQRDTATAVISALAADRGAWAVRVHDVPSTVDAVTVARLWAGDL